MPLKIYYIDHCPVCEQGLVRVRVLVSEGELRGVCVCDECDATWSDPSLLHRLDVLTPSDLGLDNSSSSDQTTDPKDEEENDLWAPTSHWGTLDEIALLGWMNSVKSSVVRANARGSEE